MKRFKLIQPKNNRKELMCVSEHLKELKKRIVVCLITFFLCWILAFFYSFKILEIVVGMAISVGFKLVYLSPPEAFVQQLKVAVVIAMYPTLFFAVIQVVLYIFPEIKIRKKCILYFSVMVGGMLFLVGLYFSYQIIIPLILKELYNLNPMNEIKAMISIENYIKFVLIFFNLFGILAEFPIIVVILTRLGIVSSKMLKKIRPYVLVIIFVFAAVITLPDIISQILVSLPIVLLYEISIFISWIFKKKMR